MRGSSGRADNLGRSPFFGPSFTNYSGHGEGETIHEKEQRVTYTATAWQNGGPPRINAANLNKLGQGVADAHAGPENRSDGEHPYPGVYQEVSGYGASVREESDRARYPRSSGSRQSAKSLQKANRPSSAKRKTSTDSSYRNSERPFPPNHSSRSQRSSARRRRGASGAAAGLLS